MNQQGSVGEQIAQEYLCQQGYVLLALNYHTRQGEVDIIAQQQETLVFAEVKARKGKSRYGMGREAVTAAKCRRIILAAQQYLQKNGGFDRVIRFDVIEVDLAKQPYDIVHIQHAFTADGWDGCK